MKRNPAELAQRMEQFKAGLNRAGVKLTHQRLVIYEELVRSSDHPDAETIYKAVRKKLPTISLDTVYRTLWLLLDLGLISTLGARDKVRFDGNSQQHHHFVCTNCGTTFDFYDSKFDGLTVPDSVKALGDVVKTQVEFYGICQRCARHHTPKESKPMTH